METSVIVSLVFILLVFVILNNWAYFSSKLAQASAATTTTTTIVAERPKCSKTQYGCCPDGIHSKMNVYGTNCPHYRAGPGFYPYAPPPIMPPMPPPPPPPRPIEPLPPMPGPKVGGCISTRYGCCPYSTKAKADPVGSNCYEEKSPIVKASYATSTNVTREAGQRPVVLPPPSKTEPLPSGPIRNRTTVPTSTPQSTS